MYLLARSAEVTIPLGRATATSAWATLAEALPLPGGAMVRAGALMSEGTGLAQSSALVLANALLWISLATLGCGLALLGHEASGALLLILAGGNGSAVTFGWLLRQAGLALALQSVLHRLSGMALIAVRLHVLTRKTLGGLETDLQSRVLRADGTAATAGNYKLRVTATNAGKAVESIALTSARVDSVSGGSDGMRVDLGAAGVRNYGDIKAFL